MPQTLAARRYALGDLRSFSKLARTYAADYAALAGYYAGDPADPAARAAAAERAAEGAAHRAAVTDVLAEQNAAWAADGHVDASVRGSLDKLRRPDSVAVVTGQQVGLFGGPLYTPYKTLTVIQLARQLEAETGRPAVPVFWLAGEDHDFDEVARTHLLCRNTLCPIGIDGALDGESAPEHGNHGPVGRLVLDEAVERALAQVDGTLVDTDFKPAVMEALRASYRPGATLRDGFARFLRHLFPDSGLVFISPDDARLKALAAPLFRREIETWDVLDARLRERTERLEADGYHAQVHFRPTNLFWIGDEGRLPIDADEDGGFTLRGTGQRLAKADLLQRLDEAPERFSPNVFLRPLMQDLLLPTAAYVAGPSETAYLAQLGPAYDWAGIPRPLVYPRISATLVEGKVQKVLDRYDLTLPDIEDDLDHLFQAVVVRGMDVDLDAVFKAAAASVHGAINELKPTLEGVDRTLGKSAEATRAALAKELEKLKQRAVRAEKRQHEEVRQQLEKATINLYPAGKLQERVLSPLYFLNKYSLSLFADLAGVLVPDPAAHQVVEV